MRICFQHWGKGLKVFKMSTKSIMWCAVIFHAKFVFISILLAVSSQHWHFLANWIFPFFDDIYSGWLIIWEVKYLLCWMFQCVSLANFTILLLIALDIIWYYTLLSRDCRLSSNVILFQITLWWFPVFLGDVTLYLATKINMNILH